MEHHTSRTFISRLGSPRRATAIRDVDIHPKMTKGGKDFSYHSNDGSYEDDKCEVRPS